jgi:endonuclease/exonuclease/phosphatase family metal-dependent hydrolase
VRRGTGLRVATWNVLHGLDVRTGRVDLDAVAATLAALEVDLVAVQEVDRELDRTGGVDQVGELAARLGWHGLFAPALLGDPGRAWRGVGAADPGGPAYGIGLLSRVTLRSAVRVALPGGGAGERPPGSSAALPLWDREPRAALRVTVVVGDAEVALTTTHLTYLPLRAVRQLRAALALAGAGGGPAVLLGDLNLPHHAVGRLLGGTGFRATPTEPTFPAWQPGMQLDHLLARGATLHDVRVAPRGPSDHLPVIATVIV